MPKRRKFITGLGALATGSVAAVGTGAFESSATDRTVNVNVAADSSGFLEITALNETYASGTGDGQLELDFNSDSGIGIFDGQAEGLNADSTFNFSEVFRIANVTGKPVVVIEASGFNLENLELTAQGDDSIGFDAGTSLLAKDYDDVNDLSKLEQPDSVDVDITIETKDDDTMGGVGGTLTIHTAKETNRDALSDVLSSGSE